LFIATAENRYGGSEKKQTVKDSLIQNFGKQNLNGYYVQDSLF